MFWKNIWKKYTLNSTFSMLIISGVGWKKPDREHIEDNLPTSSHTNQTIKDLWRNCTNTKCIFIYKCTTEVSHILAFLFGKCFLGNIQTIVVFFNLHLYSRAQLKVIFLRGFAIEKNLQWLAHSSTHIHIYMCVQL